MEVTMATFLITNLLKYFTISKDNVSIDDIIVQIQYVS